MTTRRSTAAHLRRPLVESLGEVIRRYRETAGTSRKELAAAAGLSYSYVSEIESGAKAPSTKALLSLAGALGMRLSELVSLAESPAPPQRASLTFAEAAEASSLDGEQAVLRDWRNAARGRRFTAVPAPLSRGEPDEPGLVPASLVRAIEGGRCVAFLGAGFSRAAGFPGWEMLLSELAEDPELTPKTRAHVLTRIAHGTSHAYDEAAQLLEDQLGRARLLAQLRGRLDRPSPPPAMLQRMAWLRGIPFQSILTTNFDGVLDGAVPGSAAYRSALRLDPSTWWSQDYWTRGAGAFTLKLHGDLRQGTAGPDDIVLTRRDYRRRLYEDPAYQTFLRAVMATRTVLYMGFSFEDAYLNELRSEILALVGQEPHSAPVSYAIANDVPPATREHFRAHEGIGILSYDSHGGTDHSGFDRYLAALHHETSPLQKVARHLAEKRILWIDPHPENSEPAFEHLEEAAQLSGNPTSLQLADSADAGLAHLRATEGPAYDLVITHWGEGQATDSAGRRVPTAVRLLTGMREQDLRAPVLIFAAEQDAERRKRTALGLGAQAYTFRFDALYREIERVLAPAAETG